MPYADPVKQRQKEKEAKEIRKNALEDLVRDHPDEYETLVREWTLRIRGNGGRNA